MGFNTLCHGQSFQYDTLSIVTYNTLNYGFHPTSHCPSLITSNKHRYLKEIVQYLNPDILGLVKMTGDLPSFSTDSVINVLDSVCPDCYGHSQFTNRSGYKKINMLYYKKSKLEYVGTTTIFSRDTNISDINLHKLYYKDSNLSVTHDTTYLNIVQAHLISGPNNTLQRLTEINGVKGWLDTNIVSSENILFMGDLNTKSSMEPCFQALINTSNNYTVFFDPDSQLGDWVNFPANFANYLTQSTRVTDPGDCGSVGGMNSRFDHILCTSSIMNGTINLQYIPGSFKVIGQDGLHTNQPLNGLPTDTVVPPFILNDLYLMSSHLPVLLKLRIDSQIPVKINDVENENNKFNIFPVPTSAVLHINCKVKENEKYHLLINNLFGENMFSTDFINLTL